MSNVVKFPFGVSRKARASKNDTPEERSTDAHESADARRPAESLSITAQNGRLRTERHEAWRMAEAATRYWRVRLDFEDAVSWAQRVEILEGSFHPAVDPGYRQPMVEKYRAAQFLAAQIRSLRSQSRAQGRTIPSAGSRACCRPRSSDPSICYRPAGTPWPGFPSGG